MSDSRPLDDDYASLLALDVDTSDGEAVDCDMSSKRLRGASVGIALAHDASLRVSASAASRHDDGHQLQRPDLRQREGRQMAEGAGPPRKAGPGHAGDGRPQRQRLAQPHARASQASASSESRPPWIGILARVVKAAINYKHTRPLVLDSLCSGLKTEAYALEEPGVVKLHSRMSVDNKPSAIEVTKATANTGSCHFTELRGLAPGHHQKCELHGGLCRVPSTPADFLTMSFSCRPMWGVGSRAILQWTYKFGSGR